MNWFLVITMLGSDDLLVKQMNSREECLQVKQQFINKAAKKIKTLGDITCEEGMVIEKFDTGVEKDEIL